MSETMWHTRELVINTDGWEIRVGMDEMNTPCISYWEDRGKGGKPRMVQVDRISLWNGMIPQVCEFLMALREDSMARDGYSDHATVAGGPR